MLCSPLLGQKNDVSEAVYRQASETAESLLEKANYKMERKLEFFAVREKPAHLSEWDIREVLRPDKWRTVEIRNYDGKTTKEERLWDGKTLFKRRDNGPWGRFAGGGTAYSAALESGQVTRTYRYLGETRLNGKPVDFYEMESLRVANKFSATNIIIVRYLKSKILVFGGWSLSPKNRGKCDRRPRRTQSRNHYVRIRSRNQDRGALQGTGSIMARLVGC